MTTITRDLIFLLAACLLVHFVGLGDVSFYTRGEPREGLVVREMLATGHWLVPARPEGELTRKPPLYYWVAAPLVRALPEHPELAMRLASAVPATLTAFGTWAVTRATIGPAVALPAALILVTTFEWSRAATSARIDMTLAAPLTAVLAAWMLVLEGRSRRWLVMAALGASAASLAKGPVGIVMPALAALLLAAVRRDWRVLRQLGVVPVLGTAMLAAGAWYAWAFFEQGWAFLDVVLKENVARFVDAEEGRTGHAHGVFYLPLLGLVGLMPWTPLLPAVHSALTQPRRPAVGFAALWAAVVLVFFSVANAKRSVYLLPMYPAVAILIATGLGTTAHDATRRLAALYRPALGAFAVVAILLAAGFDVTSILHGVLEPEDFHGATAIAAGIRRREALVVALGVATLLAAFVLERARRAARWHRLVFVVAAVFASWTAVFQSTIHAAIGHVRGVDTFMRDVDRLVPQGAALGHVDGTPAVRFYAPRPLVRVRPREASGVSYALLWESQLTHWRRIARPFRILAMSHNRPAKEGRLVLIVFEDP